METCGFPGEKGFVLVVGFVYLRALAKPYIYTYLYTYIYIYYIWGINKKYIWPHIAAMNQRIWEHPVASIYLQYCEANMYRSIYFGIKI